MTAALPRDHVTLDDKYLTQEGMVYLTGTQALTRLPIQQSMRDSAAGLRTGGFISGYRGSPLGRYDMELWARQPLLAQHNIRFQPGVNEDLAVTAVWGAQYIGVLPGSTVDGVFGIWYGKGPGTDRSGDALRHVGVAGTGKFGGALALGGDDHGCKSSTIYNFSDPTFIAAGLPVLYPSNTQELLDYGLHGFAMSRFSGCWIGMKVHNDVVEGGGSVHVAPDSPTITVPELTVARHLGEQGLNIRTHDLPLAGEERLVNHKLPTVLAYVRANKLNRIVRDSPHARLGVLSAGKSYQDVMQALQLLEIDANAELASAIRIGKLAMVWPLEPEFVRSFVQGLDLIVVVEEKRPLLEEQLKAVLYDLALTKPPVIMGKYRSSSAFAADRGDPVLQGWGELTPLQVARVLADVIRRLELPCSAAVATLLLPTAMPVQHSVPGPVRSPGFCSGCPHNRSTQVPDGSRAMVGIGCHAMARLADPVKTPPMYTQMGAEGMHWVGQHQFTEESHVFVNMGDGTYFHSGFLAIRQALASKATMTYKILVNGFVAMTGGQPIDGELSVHQMATELLAEGVQTLVVLTDDLTKYAGGSLPPEVELLPRSALDATMERLRKVPGLTVMIYDQPCATERRRLRKRGKWVDPAQRTFIHAAVCEGCGDCSKVSNCLSIEPLETPFGRKRQINQSSCNKDFSCVEGFCPSFVTVRGGRLRKARTSGAAPTDGFPALPEPVLPAVSGSFSLLITGIGGTGVVTIGQVLGMAAHLDGLAVSVLDVTGLAQKYGAVMSHVRLARAVDQLHANRIAAGEADTVIGCDLVVTASDESVSRMRPRRSHVVVATDVVPTTEFARNPDWKLDSDAMLARIVEGCGNQLLAFEGLRLATALMGDAIAANMMLLGAAWQSGRVPLSYVAITRAIELNGVQVEFNKACFLWGRRIACDAAAVERLATKAQPLKFQPRVDMSLCAIVKRSTAYLTAYQNEAYAGRYQRLVEQVQRAEQDLAAGAGQGERLAKAVARGYFKLLAIKDEFEVARLYADPTFKRAVAETFEGDYQVHFSVGAWPFGGIEPNGRPRKTTVGPWLMSAFSVLARLRGLRGTWLDPFRFNAERRLHLRLLAEYENDMAHVLQALTPDNLEQAVQLASLPEKVRGYGHVRERHAALVAQERAALRMPHGAAG